MAISGFIMLMYLAFPIISWKIYFEPAFASQSVTSPIPQTTFLSGNNFQSLIKASEDTLRGVDYTDAQNWYPRVEHPKNSSIVSYSIDIPKLHITDASVSTIDTDLKVHLVQYAGTPIPPEKGTTVIFGHSTLPQLYNPHDYKTIFANILDLRVGDTINAKIEGITYIYKIVDIKVVNPEDISVLNQDYSGSYLTIITCTPPGTIWKRLVLKSELQKL